MLLRALCIRVIALSLVSCLPASLAAQAIEGRITERGSGEPVQGAVVHLLDSQDRPSTGALTDASGGFMLRAPGPGRFRLRVERIGYSSTFSEVLDLGSAEVRQVPMAISPRAITLEGITARARSRGCTIRENAETVARVWEEARKALDAVALSQSGDLVLFDIESFRRELDPTTREIRSDQRRSSFGRGDNPFRSIPVEELREHGYVREFPDSTLYYAPDAAVLLSDEFLDGHCFRMSARSGGDPSLIGLEFRPRRRVSKTDIEGTVWLDRKTAALRFMEYRYVGLRVNAPKSRFGGRIEFEQALPSGAWIVRSWYIRMPRVVLHRQRSQNYATGAVVEREERVLSAVVEEGGEVVSVYSPHEAARRSAGEVALTGVVVDSLTGRPLAGATVYLSGTSFSATTDNQGRYSIPNAPRGRHVISFTHPRLHALGVLPFPRQVELDSAARVTIDLATSSLDTVLERYCPASVGEREGMLTGHAKDARTGEPIPGAQVRVVWTRSEVEGGSLTQRITRSGAIRPDLENTRVKSNSHEIEVSADGSGFFRVCGVPLETRLEVHGRVGQASVRQPFRLGRNRVATQDVLISQR